MALIFPCCFLPIWQGSFTANLSMALSYLAGTILSAIAGKIGILVATLSNARTAQSAQQGLKARSLLVYFRGRRGDGAAGDGCSLLGVAAVMITGDSSILLGFSFGASSLALFVKAGYLHQDRRRGRRPDRQGRTGHRRG